VLLNEKEKENLPGKKQPSAATENTKWQLYGDCVLHDDLTGYENRICQLAQYSPSTPAGNSDTSSQPEPSVKHRVEKTRLSQRKNAK